MCATSSNGSKKVVVILLESTKHKFKIRFKNLKTCLDKRFLL